MCHRISPLLIQELTAALEELQATGRATVPPRDPDLEVPDVYPGKQLPFFAVGANGSLEPTQLTWGFDNPRAGQQKLVFNTRIETALSQARSGYGLWAEALATGRCLVPVRAFYESWTVSPPRRGAQARFTFPRRHVFLLAGIHNSNRVSVVTTAPNASVAPLHTRMPLVLGPGESSVWLSPDYARLADRSAIRLDATPEE